MDVGQRLRQLRLEAGLSQRALAKKAGVSNATISMVEANQVSPSISALKQILSGFPLG
ncbi:helix-turn-helix domain-containing protein, partial [Klebsiella pneumoniae]|uniref:helix-turn-helix domain-containing protein n=1 Tax=Klebsiella pneumoniae TaxID=573 RepID=UPI0038552A91